MLIFTKCQLYPPDPVIVYFEVVWYKKLSNERENLPGLIIWVLQVDYTRNFVTWWWRIKSLFEIWNPFLTTKNSTNSANCREGNRGASEKLRYLRVSLHFKLREKRFSIFMTILWIVQCMNCKCISVWTTEKSNWSYKEL